LTPELPRRAHGRVPWLPVLGRVVIDDPDWRFRDDGDGFYGTARLRVWNSLEPGHFAVVTARGDGLSVTSGAAAIWLALLRQLGEPLGLAEYWPGGESGPAHADLVLPPRNGCLEWQRLWPARPGHPLHGMLSTWWLVHGSEVLA
jgi:hypothetical protein